LPNASDQRGVIADKCDDASTLFADIAGFTNRASDTTPADLVRFLDRLYTQLDELVELHGLEKIKTSGDSYMVVSGVPQQRPDHVEALASFALDVAAAVANLKDPDGAAPLRIGIGIGPVIAGVVGTRRFFYDMGRCRQCRVPNGVDCPRRAHPGATNSVRAPQTRLRDGGARGYRGKGQGHDAHLVSSGTP
jgi:hypothetical protein